MSVYKRGKSNKEPHLKRLFDRDDENRVIVNMTVKDDSEFLSTFSPSNTPRISSEVADFIENITSAVPPSEALALRIHSNCIDEQEKGVYRTAIAEYYKGKYIANGWELRRNNMIAIFLTLAGAAVLALMIFLKV